MRGSIWIVLGRSKDLQEGTEREPSKMLKREDSLMNEDEKDEEIIVPGPLKAATPPEKRREKVVERALEEERFGVLHVSRRIGESFSVSVLAAGICLVLALAYLGLTGQQVWLVKYSGTLPWVIVLWIFLGIVNIVGGMLLMGSE